ncbi:hypothetical protein RB8065 [Rhodopirellula baltica SH 1]|uniref:Uncharacterized protein n=1 Tax=Rhodopirellula baltica (strain DSM 10527 / NCIMB 13988 / SH1) TaxID=243090 RepID=Q7UG81_RHOBA|nr:hypothetical protein RB8065 [Rhodopirellula baltica SH 1]
MGGGCRVAAHPRKRKTRSDPERCEVSTTPSGSEIAQGA